MAELFWDVNFTFGHECEIASKNTPLEISDILIELGRAYNHSATMMHEHKDDVITILQERNLHQVINWLWPNGWHNADYNNNIRWHNALHAMVMRNSLARFGRDAWTVEGFRKEYMQS